MESNGENKKVERQSSSFRLRSPSLNALRLQRIFDLFDKNGDGFITLEELNQALSRLGLDADLSDLKSTVESYIQPGNTGLDFDDFTSLHKTLDESFFGGAGDCDESSPESAEEADLVEAFKVFDENGDGFISARELQAVLKKLGLPEGSEMERVEKMIVSVDRNQDGRVDFSEFKNMMRIVALAESMGRLYYLVHVESMGIIAEKLITLDLPNSAAYVLLNNTYSSVR
ncbi:unnamed protein product [Brassica rapa]|uniref:EF-hand domain-containing protein n=1 Tax=Brassica campestris TaxID=3711 RepID=A0A3P5ZQY0_BRACM|nr:unnamed protein product [Brassica rapa]VDC83106.1 unnamed protein product [Brassica rapa]